MALVTKTFSDIITFTRTSTATFFNSSGVLTSAGNNVPRFDYNPATLAAQGLLIEEQRTNRIANTVVSGSISIGTGSAIGPNGQPMNTAIIGSGAMSFPQLGVGSGNAQSFTLTAGQSIDVALSGWFAAGTAGMIIEPRLIADFRTAPSTNFTYAELQINTSTWTVRAKTLGVDITEVSAPSITLFSTGVYRVTWVVRYTQGATIRDVSGAYIQLRDSTGSGTFTGDGIGNFQYFGLQGETGSFPTSYIPTTVAAVTRNADQASVNTLSPWYNNAAGTVFSEWAILGVRATNNQRVWSLSDGTLSQFIAVRIDSAAQIRGEQTGGSTVPTTVLAVASANTVYKTGVTFQAGDSAICLGGGTVYSNTTFAYPAGINKLTLGNLATGSYELSGHLRRITYYPRRLSNAELQTITA